VGPDRKESVTSGLRYEIQCILIPLERRAFGTEYLAMAYKSARLTAALAGTMILLGAASAQASIFSDNFDAEGPGLNLVPAGWSLTQGSVDIIGQNTVFDYYPGHGQYIDLNGTTNQYGGIRTNQLFGPGTYRVNFKLGSSVGGAGGVDSATTPKVTEILLGNSKPVFVSLPSLPAAWTSQDFILTTTISGSLAFNSMPDINIGSPYNRYVGNILDNVSVSSTPLPSTWTTMLIGFFGLGLIAYRGTRKRSSSKLVTT
jgi:hypothetical protein